MFGFRCGCVSRSSQVNTHLYKQIMHMNAESVGKGQDFGIGGALVSVCSPIVVRVVLTNHV